MIGFQCNQATLSGWPRIALSGSSQWESTRLAISTIRTSIVIHSLEIDAGRIQSDLNELSRISDCELPCVTRILWTEKDLEARVWLKRKMEDAGLIVREDAVGNIFGRLQADANDAAAIATGSHNDAIPFSGMYDGTVGVLGGLEVLRAIAEYLVKSGSSLSKSIDLIMFTAEEPTSLVAKIRSQSQASSRFTLELLTAFPEKSSLKLIFATSIWSGVVEFWLVFKKKLMISATLPGHRFISNGSTPIRPQHATQESWLLSKKYTMLFSSLRRR